MDARSKAPYFAPKDRLPAPLPLPQVFEAASVVLEEYTSRRVVRFGESYIIKYGFNVTLKEGETLLFLKETQMIPVPEVFALYSREVKGGQVNYSIMENILGRTLNSCCDALQSCEKENIARQLRNCFTELRNIPAPGYWGCVGGNHTRNRFFWASPNDDPDHSRQIRGPFTSEAELNTALVHKCIYNDGSAHKAKFYSQLFSVLRDHSVVFTHGDLQRKNIIMKDDKTLITVDWEAAGWYPEYREYTSATLASAAWKDDWHEYVMAILDEYPNEYAWFDMIIREVWS